MHHIKSKKGRLLLSFLHIGYYILRFIFIVISSTDDVRSKYFMKYLVHYIFTSPSTSEKMYFYDLTDCIFPSLLKIIFNMQNICSLHIIYAMLHLQHTYTHKSRQTDFHLIL